MRWEVDGVGGGEWVFLWKGVDCLGGDSGGISVKVVLVKNDEKVED